jgi:hypothetical protein
MSPKKLTFALSGALLLVLTACGSGGGGTEPPIGEDPAFWGAGVAGLNHTFIYGSLSGSNYRLGALADTGGSVKSAGEVPATSEVDWLFQASISGGNVYTSHINQLVFWKAGRLVRQDTIGLNALPALKQVSTLLDSQVCAGGTELSSGSDGSYVPVGADLNDANLTWKIFAKAGPDSACSTWDDTFVAVRMNMAATDAPLEIARPVAAIHAANGALTGWLLRSGQEIRRVDASFGSPVIQFTLPGPDLGIAIGAGPDETYLGNAFIFSSDGKVFAAALDSPGPQVPTLVSAIPQEYLRTLHHADAGSVIVAINSTIPPFPTRFVRYTIASKASTPIGSFPYSALTIKLTPSRIVTTDEGVLASLPLAGGTPTTISTASAALWISARGGERIWREVGTSVVSINADGSGSQTLADAKIAGCIRKPSIAAAQFNVSECREVLIVKGGMLQAYRAVEGTLRVTYGSIVAAAPPRTSSFAVSYATEWSAQGAVLSQYNFNADGSADTALAYRFTTDRAGLHPITLP